MRLQSNHLGDGFMTLSCINLDQVFALQYRNNSITCHLQKHRGVYSKNVRYTLQILSKHPLCQYLRKKIQIGASIEWYCLDKFRITTQLNSRFSLETEQGIPWCTQKAIDPLLWNHQHFLVLQGIPQVLSAWCLCFIFTSLLDALLLLD